MLAVAEPLVTLMSSVLSEPLDLMPKVAGETIALEVVKAFSWPSEFSRESNFDLLSLRAAVMSVQSAMMLSVVFQLLNCVQWIDVKYLISTPEKSALQEQWRATA